MNETSHDLARARRDGDILVAELLKLHRVLSTSPVAGGMGEDIRRLVNHKMGEPDDDVDVAKRPWDGVAGYVRHMYAQLGVDAERTATMLTAASMENASAERRDLESLSVLAAATAGGEGNAARAGRAGPGVRRVLLPRTRPPRGALARGQTG